jgi:hypothetical protein
MLLGLEHATDHEVLKLAHAVALDALDLGAGQREPVGQRVRVDVGSDVFVKPGERDAHQPNCSKKRTSLS